MWPQDERSARLLLNLAAPMEAAAFGKIIARFGSAAAALAAPAAAWAETEGVDPALAHRLRRAVQEALPRLEEEKTLLQQAAARAIISTDEEFPEGLKSLPDAPPVLYVKGDLRPRDAFAVALVGTRRPTPYGRAVAERMGRELAEAGITVVSGLARGIDTAAHAGALRGGGRTVGVLGGGLERFYPPENKFLADRMAAQGAVLSEFPLTYPSLPVNFPRRNRIISGLSLAVAVVEADQISGALITARLAAEQGRDVFAVPGPVFSKVSRGPHKLIKDGARLVESVEDILEEIEVFRGLIRQRARAAAKPSGGPLSPSEARLLSHITLEPVGLDQLSARTGLAPAEVSAALLSLELKGLVRTLPGKSVARTETGLETTPVRT